MTPHRVIGRRFDTGECVALELADGRIRSILIAPESPDTPWISPGWLDLQINGHGGIAFNGPGLTVDGVVQVGRAMAACGVSGYMPTMVTDSHENFVASLQTLAEAIETRTDVAQAVLGLHVEGPYISREDGPRGAHPLAHVRPPDWDEFQRLQDAARGHIKKMTVSAEYPESPEFIAKVTATGVLVSIGHTMANAEQIRRAVDAGAGMCTHLGNGAHPYLRRHPNYIWDQLAEDRLAASLIVDGCHLPPAVVKAMVRAKTPQRCLLVSDITSISGLPPGRYDTNFGGVESLEDGRLVVAGQRDILAGASFPLHYCVANVQRFADVDLKTAIHMVTTAPAGVLGRMPPMLEAGHTADLTLFRNPVKNGRNGHNGLDRNGSSHAYEPSPERTPMEVVGVLRAGTIAYAAPGAERHWE